MGTTRMKTSKLTYYLRDLLTAVLSLSSMVANNNVYALSPCNLKGRHALSIH